MTYLEQLFNLVDGLIELDKDVVSADTELVTMQAVLRIKTALRMHKKNVDVLMDALEKKKKELIKSRGLDSKDVARNEAQLINQP